VCQSSLEAQVAVGWTSEVIEDIDKPFKVVAWIIAIASLAGTIVTYWGYIWWHPFGVLLLNCALFFVAIVGSYAAWRSHMKRRSDLAWQFNPDSIRIRTQTLNFTGLTKTDPTLYFYLTVLNASGRNLEITGIEGRVQCGGDSGLVAAQLDQPHQQLPIGSLQSMYFHQVFSPAVAEKIINELKGEGTNVSFDCSSMRLVGVAGKLPIAIPLYQATCRVKGPFLLDGDDQANMWPLEYTLVSQTRYEIWSGNRKNK
jgi:hypothetical protein